MRMYHPEKCPPILTPNWQTDDTLPFRNNIIGEYAMLLATPPLGLGLSNQVAERLAQMSMAARFPQP